MTGRPTWFSVNDIAGLRLPQLPATGRGVQHMVERERWDRPEWEGERWRQRTARGGGVEYHVSVLPKPAQVVLALAGTVATDDERTRAAGRREDLWDWYARLPAAKRTEAERRLKVLDDIQTLVQAGMRKTVAAQQIAVRSDCALSGVYRWEALVAGAERCDWLPLLAPKHAGRPGEAECSPDAWEALKADYLRLERPNFTDCYRRIVAAADKHGWVLPSRATLMRRIETLPEAVRVLAREGSEAAKRLYPAQIRDRSAFHALQAVNADGHKWDVFVRWPDGTIGRPVMVAFQDLYSGRMLSWRVDRSENKEAVRLAFGDMVAEFGIPDECYLDNGRNFASKWLTGGIPNRFRFKVRDEDPVGILTQLGVVVHWTTPYSGQSKPIERGFRDFAQSIARHPAFAGAWCGNNPMAKPENYGSKAIPIERFVEVIAAGIAEHNARPGRQSRVCNGQLSFDAAFNVSYQASPIRKASSEQRRLWLLAAESVRVSRRDGSIEIAGNRYWSDILLGLRGQLAVVRFDPERLHDDVHVYRQDGGYLGVAPCTAAAGFADVEAARTHGRARRSWLRSQADMLRAERAMSLDQVLALQAEAPEPPPPPAAKIVRMVRGSSAVPVATSQEQLDDRYEREAARQARLIGGMAAAARAGRPSLQIVGEDEDE